jgi:pimeloyl-ACP methyl ester carboxylesterase
MPAERMTVAASGGTQLEVLVAGPSAGLPLLFHSGTPSGLVEWPLLAQAAADRGLRLVLYSRPGYGGSTPLRGRSVADAASDAAAILDRVGARHFVTAGWSGGGPHALAVAALLGDRCLAAASIAGVRPYGSGPDWHGGMAAENVEEFRAALAGERALTGYLEPVAKHLRHVTAGQVAAALGGLLSEADVVALTTEFAEVMAASFRAAVASGIAGWRDDDLAFVRDWGFGLDRLGTAVPVSVWQGDQDMMVPLSHGRWLAAAMPAATAHLLPGEGHLTLLAGRAGEILDELVRAARG